MTAPVCADLARLREHVAAWRFGGKRVALVPTMGSLHAGHLRLIEAAHEVADRVIATIFVNPKQFGPGEDFQSYPRDFLGDCRKVASAGGDLIYAPDMATMYPHGFATSVTVAGPAAVGLEDRFRPGHFAGVATVVAKLLNQVRPDVSLFGEKDYQQLRVIERMVLDLDLPVAILALPTVRDHDGLALSSRNVYLDAGERARAPALHKALVAAAWAIGRGDDVATSVAAARRAIDAAGFVIDYVEARRADDLAPLENGDAVPGRLLAAVRLGRTRLIDNVAIAAARRPLPDPANAQG